MQTIEASRDFFNFMGDKNTSMQLLDETTENFQKSGALVVIEEAARGLAEASGFDNPALITSFILLGYSFKLYDDKRSLENFLNLEYTGN